MFEVSEALAAALEEQPLQIRVTRGEQTLEADQIMNLRYSASCGGEGAITMGGVTAATVRMTVAERLEWLDEVIVVDVGAEVSGVVQYVPLGTFAIVECDKGEYSTELVGYDAAHYCMGGTYVPTVTEDPTIADILGDVANQCGLTLAEFPTIRFIGNAIRETIIKTSVIGQDALNGYTCREMSGMMAALVGCNALIDRTGALALRQLAFVDGLVTAEEYYSGGLTLDGSFQVGFIACTVPLRSIVQPETSRVIRVGNGDTGITIKSPYMTQAMLAKVWLGIGGLNFLTGSCSIVGGLLLEPGDMVLMREPDGTSYRFPAQTLELTIDGGCMATLRAIGKSGTETSANVTGSVAREFQAVNDQIVELRRRLLEETALPETDCDATTYDTFSGDIVTSGSITVVKKLGWCQVFGAVTPNASSSSWVTILDSTKVPAPQHGTAMYMTVPYWSSSYSMPIRFRIKATGGLDIARGTVNGSYWFTVTYPIG